MSSERVADVRRSARDRSFERCEGKRQSYCHQHADERVLHERLSVLTPCRLHRRNDDAVDRIDDHYVPPSSLTLPSALRRSARPRIRNGTPVISVRLAHGTTHTGRNRSSTI